MSNSESAQLPSTEQVPWERQMVWRKTGMPPKNQRVLAYAAGAKGHSGALFKRDGFVFMVAWDSPTETVAGGWARRFYDDACRQLDADYLHIEAWMPLEKPE